MIDRYLTDTPWIGLAILLVLSVSDYYLTLWGARLRERTKGFIDLGGSYEMNPEFRTEIDELRPISPKFFWRLLLSAALLVFVWWLAVSDLEMPALFLVLIGALLFLELVIHMRHRHNISFYRSLQHAGAVEGHIRYQRWVVERQSEVDLTSFGGLFLVCLVISGHPAFIGGAFGCVLTAYRLHRKRTAPAS